MHKGVIVQARTGSTRLPDKVLINIRGKAVLEHLLERLSYAHTVDEIIVATSDKPDDSKITEIAHNLGLGCFEGSENDVLSRFIGAARQFQVDLIIRVSADCPLMDPGLLDHMVGLHLEEGGDYTSNVLKRTFPRGIAAEVFPLGLLEQLSGMTRERSHREHVTSFVREHPSRFKINSYETRSGLYNPEWRWVLDTPADLPFIRAVFQHLYREGSFFTLEDILEFMNSSPEYMRLCRTGSGNG